MDARTPSTDINAHKIVVTTFRDQLAKERKRQHWSIPELREIVLKTGADTKKKLPWLKCADFGEKGTPKGSLRHDANVVSVSGVELDYDAKLISIEEVVATLKESGIRALAYTSPSNTKTEFKWRVVAPFSKELPPHEREKYAKRLGGALGITFDRASFTLSQSFYYGKARDNVEADHKAFVVDGDFIDLRDDLSHFDRPWPSANTAATKPMSKGTAPEDEGRKYAEKNLKQFYDELTQAPLGTRNHLLYRRSKDMGKMITPEWIDRDTVEETILAAIAHWDDQPKCRDTMKRGIEDGTRSYDPAAGQDGWRRERQPYRHQSQARGDDDAAGADGVLRQALSDAS
jgi:hypothetical protein